VYVYDPVRCQCGRRVVSLVPAVWNIGVQQVETLPRLVDARVEAISP